MKPSSCRLQPLCSVHLSPKAKCHIPTYQQNHCITPSPHHTIPCHAISNIQLMPLNPKQSRTHALLAFLFSVRSTELELCIYQPLLHHTQVCLEEEEVEIRPGEARTTLYLIRVLRSKLQLEAAGRGLSSYFTVLYCRWVGNLESSNHSAVLSTYIYIYI